MFKTDSMITNTLSEGDSTRFLLLPEPMGGFSLEFCVESFDMLPIEFFTSGDCDAILPKPVRCNRCNYNNHCVVLHLFMSFNLTNFA